MAIQRPIKTSLKSVKIIKVCEIINIYSLFGDPLLADQLRTAALTTRIGGGHAGSPRPKAPWAASPEDQPLLVVAPEDQPEVSGAVGASAGWPLAL